MKALKLILCLLLGVSLTANAAESTTSEDKNHHRLVELWKSYDRAASKDLPKEQERILNQIIEKAKAERYSWDFYDALNKLSRVVIRSNWKRAEGIEKKIDDEVKKYDDFFVSTIHKYFKEPRLITDEWIREKLIPLREKLSQEKNEGFYTMYFNGWSYGDDVLRTYIKNDYDYLAALIRLRLRYYNNNVKESTWESLDKTLGYPLAPYIEYLYLKSTYYDLAHLLARLEYFSEKNSDKAVSVFAQAESISQRIDNVERSMVNKGSKEQDFKNLRKECENLKDKIRNFKGEEETLAKMCLPSVENMIKELDGEYLRASICLLEAKIFVKNIPEVNLKILERDSEKVVWEKKIVNPYRTYYATDTLSCKFPENLNDGKYIVEIKSKHCNTKEDYFRNTIVFAQRTNAEGVGVYLVDRITGEPVRTATLHIDNNKVENIEFEGFTCIAPFLEKYCRKERSSHIYCSYTDEKGIFKCTGTSYANTEKASAQKSTYSSAVILSDRKAYNPGDTIRFYTCIYENSPEGTKILKNRKLDICLTDRFMETVQTISTTTGILGNASGEFVLPKEMQGGTYFIMINDDENQIYESERIVIDEFVLPTYHVEFEDSEKIYHSGDCIKVRGKIKAYSGHSVSDVKMRYELRCNWEECGNFELQPNADGSFEISFNDNSKPASSANYSIYLTVTDSTGETQQWRTSVRVNPSISLEVYLLEEDKAYTADLEASILKGEVAQFSTRIRAYDYPHIASLPGEILWRVANVNDPSKTLLSGKIEAGKNLEIDFSDLYSGCYIVDLETDFEGQKLKSHNKIIKIALTDVHLDKSVPFIVKQLSDEKVSFQIGSSDGERWVAAELYDEDCRLVHSEIIKIGGRFGEIKVICYDTPASYKGKMLLNLDGYKNGRNFGTSLEFDVKDRMSELLPLEFETFTDHCQPGMKCSFSFRTSPEAIATATVYDISSDRIMSNRWRGLSIVNNSSINVNVHWNTSWTWFDFEEFEEFGYEECEDVPLQIMACTSVPESAAPRSQKTSPAKLYGFRATSPNMVDDMYPSAGDDDDLPQNDVQIRSDFSATLGFFPNLRPNAEGLVKFDLRASDKMSTFAVQIFAHDESMRNSVLRREMIVSQDLKVSIFEPRFLYGGDVAGLAISVSNVREMPLEGTLSLYLYDGEKYMDTEPLLTQSVRLPLPANGSASNTFMITTPVVSSGKMGIKAVFSAAAGKERISDGVFVSVPVLPSRQFITEAHSCLVRSGEDREQIRSRLAAQFTGTSSEGAQYREISLLDLIMAAIPSHIDTEAEDVLSLTKTYYSLVTIASMKEETLDKKLTDKILEKIFRCQNSDGGFGWLPGFTSSEWITAKVLARLAITGHVSENLEKGAKYLDSQMMSDKKNHFCGISISDYLYVRSLYPDVPVKHVRAEFKKELRAYFDEIFTGDIPSKVVRCQNAMNLLCGGKFASSLGVSSGKLKKLVSQDINSLSEYAASHPSGGIYFPNAVLPFRGIVASEALYHSRICDMMQKYADLIKAGYVKPSKKVSAEMATEMADGICLWLMVQKETQKWDETPAFVEALNSVLNASQQVKQSSIAVLSKIYELPFEQVKAAGNGISIEQHFYREDGRTEILPGEQLTVGEKIIAIYKIVSEENRSLVQIVSPRYAALQPVQQKSGYYGLRPGSWYWFAPRAYREVRHDRTNWFIEVCPEMESTYREEFFVVRPGTFTAPACTVESHYAPEYRANAAFHGVMTVR